MDDGSQLGIMSPQEAMAIAEEKNLDLVEISPRSRPPVCRIMDYGRFKYSESKKKKEARKHASTVEVKEVKFRPKTDEHDKDFKIRHVRRFLEEGNKVRLVIVFRGREVTHPETGKAVLDLVVQATSDLGQVEAPPNMEGRRMMMIVAPRAGVIRRAPVKPLPVPALIEEPEARPKPATASPARAVLAWRPAVARYVEILCASARCRGTRYDSTRRWQVTAPAPRRRDHRRAGRPRKRLAFCPRVSKISAFREVSTVSRASSHHAQDEVEVRRQEAFPRHRHRQVQTPQEGQAPHPHQEGQQAEAPAAQVHPGS
jgi:translation initiation factor IF-3